MTRRSVLAKRIRPASRPTLSELSFTVPMVPPSVNSYVRHSRGRHYRTKPADDFSLLVKQAVAGRQVRADFYAVTVIILLGPKQRGDIDNFAKVVLDSLVQCGAIDSDSRITSLAMMKGRVPAAGNTSVEVRPHYPVTVQLERA